MGTTMKFQNWRSLFAYCAFIFLFASAVTAQVPSTTAPTTTIPSDANAKLRTAWFQECKDRIAAKVGKPVDIIFIGDSITQNWPTIPNSSWGAAGGNIWQHWYAKRNALAFGVGADKTQDVLWRLGNMNIQQFHPKVAVILVGTNNTRDTAPDIAAGIRAVVHKTQEDFPGVKIILVSILPRVGPNDLMLEANALVKPMADNRSIFYFDLNSLMTPVGDNHKGLSADHVHPLPAGYELWAESMEPLLDRLLAMKSPSPEIAPASITHRIACVGDSITKGGSASDEDHNYPNLLEKMLGPHFQVANFGEDGATLLKSGDSPYWQRDSFARSALFQPNAVIIMLGTNDSKPQNWVHQSDFAADYSALLDYYAALPSHPHLYVCLPTPVVQSAYGIAEGPIEAQIPIIRRIATQKGAVVIDVHSKVPSDAGDFMDGVHPNDTGYLALSSAVYQGITQAPVILPLSAGSFSDTVDVTIQPPSPTAQVRYTTNGHLPNAKSTLYRGSFQLKETTTINAQAFVSGKPSGWVSTATFTQVPTGTAP